MGRWTHRRPSASYRVARFGVIFDGVTTTCRPEVAFALAALRRDGGAASAQGAAAQRVSDWDSVERFATRHAIGFWVACSMPATVDPVQVREALHA